MADCPTENTLVELVDGRLAAEEADRVLAHADGCPVCMALLLELARPLGGGSATRATHEPPDRFDEYRILRPIGEGAMGRVYLGHDTLLDRPVAIKFLAGAADRDRFLVEARAVARVQHPNVVAIHRVGLVEDRPYLVTELVRGPSLRELRKPVDGATAVRIGIGLARGLAEAHRQNVLHRDIKPANAMLTPDDEVKLLDFGLAALADDHAPGPRMVVGTPAYMAPEVARGEPASARSDVYSLGAVLHELATGAPDAPGPAPDPALAAIIERCRRPAPEERFADGAAVLVALEALRRRPARRRVPWRGAALALGVAGAAAAAFVLTRPAPPTPPAAAFLGAYRATWRSTVRIDTPPGVPPMTYTDTAIITVTAIDGDHILMSWRVGSNDPSGTIIFAVTGTSASATGTGTGGTCFTGRLKNGNVQTTCGTEATATIDGDTLTQPQSGTMRGVTPDAVDYTGSYQGVWTGTRIR